MWITYKNLVNKLHLWYNYLIQGNMNIKRVVVGLLQENCYIVEKDDMCIIIDPGDEFDKIIDNIVYPPIAILITHNHFDHVGALTQLKEKYNIPVYNYKNLKEGEFSTGQFKLNVIYTPGHTSDSITFYFKEDEIMFTGDFLFKESIGRTDLSTGNFKEMQKSIRKILAYSAIIKVYPGHGDDTTLGLEKKYNEYLKQEEL